MKLSDLIGRSRLIEVCCQDCRAKTPLDPAFFFNRRGDIDLKDLRKRMYCAQCGSQDIAVAHCSPSDIEAPTTSATLRRVIAMPGRLSTH